MSYFILFNLLPIEIVYKIYLIDKKNNSISILNNFISKSKYINHSVTNLIQSKVIENRKIYFLNDNNYNFIKFIYINHIKKSRIYFIHLLNFVSIKLNLIRNHIHLNNLNVNANSDYSNYKKFYTYWFKICIKYNIRLQIIKKGVKFNFYNNLLAPARKINKIKSYSNLFKFPTVLNDDYEAILCEESVNYLMSELNIID